MTARPRSISPAPEGAGIESGSVRVGTLLPIRNVLLNLGMRPEELFAEAGIDPKIFEDPDNRLSLPAHNHLVNLAVQRSGCPHLGLLIGESDGLPSLGLTGLLVRYSPNVETALRSFVRYLPTHVRGAGSSLTVADGVATLGWVIYEPGLEALDQVSDAALAIFFNIIRELCGDNWRPLEVYFAHREPAQVQPYSLFFRTTLRFDAEEYAICFDAGWLERPVAQADPLLRRVLQKELDTIAARYGANFPENVRSVLRSAILTGHADASQIAALFSIHSSTLVRRLKPYGLTFRDLVDECRYEVAREMLSHSALGVSQIAASLDYADASAFTRAFRRWSGTTPAHWRVENAA